MNYNNNYQILLKLLLTNQFQGKLFQIVIQRQNKQINKTALCLCIINKHYKYNQLQMNPLNMRIPVFSQIIEHKQIHQAHLKKLQNIKHHRQTQLGIDFNRSKFIDFVRESKNKTFANRFNSHYDQINQQNLRFVKKLEKARTVNKFSTTRSCHNEQNSLSNKSCMSIPKNQNLCRSRVLRQKTIETQKQNLRLLLRLKTTQSSVNNSKLKNDFAKAQKIKQRLMKYSCKQNQQGSKIVLLKSQRYIDVKSSYLSSKSRDKSKSQYSTLQPKKITTVNFYKREDIIKNKVQNEKSAANQNSKRLSNLKNKVITSRMIYVEEPKKIKSLKQTLETIQQKRQDVDNIYDNDNQNQSQFFPTQITKKHNSNLPNIGLSKSPNLTKNQGVISNSKINTFLQTQQAQVQQKQQQQQKQKQRVLRQNKMQTILSKNKKDSRSIYLNRNSTKK